MNESSPAHVRPDAATHPRRFVGLQDYIPAIAVFAATLWIGCGAISKSYLFGRLANPITHNDVNYLIDGIRRLLYIEVNGFWAEVLHLYREPLHAPVSGYQAALSFYVFGFHDWAPYASDIVYLLVLLAVSAALLRGLPNLVVIGGLAAVAGMPLASTTVSEFAPEIPLGLFTALGVLLTLRIPMFDRAIARRALGGLCFGLGFLGKPTSFAFVPLVVCATLGVVFFRDVVFARQIHKFGRAIYHGTLQLLLSLWLPALYVIPNYGYYNDYFYLALFDSDNVKAFASSLSTSGHLLYFLTGSGAEYMFGNLLWAYVGTIALGIAAALRRGDGSYTTRQLELLILVVFLWLLPTPVEAKNLLFGVPFAYLLAFMLVMALGSIYRTFTGRTGVAAALLLGLLLFVSGTSRNVIPNAPAPPWFGGDSHVLIEKWREAQDRFGAVMLGNSPDYYGRSVYLTNVGYYHIPTLWYSFLKKDPTLDWSFNSLWKDSDPQNHIAFISANRPDFVIAGERDNGLTFAPILIPGAAAAEDAVLAALWVDPDYKPVDQFYGPTGRTITVFQRSEAFSGWRLLAGVGHYGTKDSWVNDGTIAHLQAYAPDAISAQLTIDAKGHSGQTIDVFVNRDRIGRLIFDAGGKSSFAQSIKLAAGENDIIFCYSSAAPVRLERVLVTREISPNR